MERYWYLEHVMVFLKLVVGHVYKRVVDLLSIASCGFVCVTCTIKCTVHGTYNIKFLLAVRDCLYSIHNLRKSPDVVTGST